MPGVLGERYVIWPIWLPGRDAAAETARRLELQPQRLANYLAGRHQPDLETVARICATLGLSPNFLLGFEPEEPSSQKKMQIAAINVQL